MSNAIRYDALLVRDLAAELNRELAGHRLDEASLDRDSLRVSLQPSAGRRSDPQPPALLWHLHPGDGALVRRIEPVDIGGRVQLGSPSFIRSVTAPPDERLLLIELAAGDAAPGVARTLVIELVTNQWNALALASDGRIVSVLRERRTRDRELRAGIQYRPPAPSQRDGRDGPLSRDQWVGLLGEAAPGTRLNALVRRVAFTSPVNAAAILGDADVDAGAAALDRAYDRYCTLIWNSVVEPCLLRGDGTVQPYSRALDSTALRTSSLLDAFTAVSGMPVDTTDRTERALDAIAQRIEVAQRRIRRMSAQQEGAAAEAERLRQHADLLLAQLPGVVRGAASAELDDFAGGVVRIELDPSLSPADNAQRMYEAARKRGRAAARMPQLIDAAHREVRSLEELAARARDGSISADTLARLTARQKATKNDESPSLPYREYRTTRGLEVRVGRGSRANDALTFRHSSPTDIWLHARDVAGAHVILRWARAEENPPAADIAEAAALAAVFSRARTSGLVAVDWTRRKWVRKPRKAAPGLVIPERVKTVFVEPDAALEERLRAASY